MNKSPGLLKNYLKLRSNVVRNAGGHAPGPHAPLIPFPPGPRQFSQVKNWLGSAAVFGATSFTLLCYLSDWRVVVDWIPFYNGKFNYDEEPKK